jgi:hypothetical protein
MFDWQFAALLLSNGILIGLMYSLIALGFVLVYKATDAINFAQGEFVMIAGFVVAVAITAYGAPLWLAVLVGLAGMIGFGFGLERVMLRKLIGRPVIAVVMATIGLAAILRGFGPMVWGAGTKSLALPIPEEPIILGPLFIPPIQLLGAAVSLLFLAAFSWFFLRSRRGIAMRAVADNQQVAMAMGINVELLRARLGHDRHRVGPGRYRVGQPAGRRRPALPRGAQGLPGGDPGRARLDPGGHRGGADRGNRGEHGRGLHRPLRGRRDQGLRPLRADDHCPDGPALRDLRQGHHRADLRRSRA